MGGIFFRSQAQALAERGLAITVVTPTPWAPPPLPALREKWRLYARAPLVSQDGVVRVFRPRFLNIPGQPSTMRPDRLIASAALRCSDAWASAQLVHGHYAVTGLAAARVAKKLRLPLVLSFHGSDINTWPDAHPERRADLVAALRQAAVVTAVSRPLTERIRELSGVDALHLPVGSDHQAITKNRLPRRDARRMLRLPENAVVVLFVGNLLQAKGVRELVSAILRLGHPFLGVFVGTGPEIGYGTDEPGGRALLLYKGQRTHAEVVHYMSAADLLVLPSYSEGLPSVLVEAGALSLPVVATPVGGIPDLLGNGRGTLLPGIGVDEVERALAYFVDHRDEADAAALALHEHVSDHHDVRSNAARLHDLYDAIVRDREGRVRHE